MRNSYRGVRALLTAGRTQAFTRCFLQAHFSSQSSSSYGLVDMIKRNRKTQNTQSSDDKTEGNVTILHRFKAAMDSVCRIAAEGDCHKAINDFYSAVTELPPHFDPTQQSSTEMAKFLQLLYTSEDFDADDFPILMDALYKCELDSNKIYQSTILTLKFVQQNIDAILGITFDISNRRVAYYILLMVISLQEPFQSFFRNNVVVDEVLLAEIRNKFVDRALKDHLFASTDTVDQIKMIRACVESRPKAAQHLEEETKLILGVISDLVSKCTTQFDALQLILCAQGLSSTSPDLCRRLDEHYISLGKSPQHSLSVKMLSARDLYYLVSQIEGINAKFPLSGNSVIKQIKWRICADKAKFGKLARALLEIESPLINSIKLNEMKGFLMTPFEAKDYQSKNMIIILNIMLEEARRRQESFYGSRFTLDVAGKLMDYLDQAPLRIMELNSLKNIISNLNRLLPTQGYIDRVADVVANMASKGYLHNDINQSQVRKIPVVLHSFINSFLDPTHPALSKLSECFLENEQDSRKYLESKGSASYLSILAQLTSLWMLKLQTYPEAIKKLPQHAREKKLAELVNQADHLSQIKVHLEKLTDNVFKEFKKMTDSKFQLDREVLSSIIELCDTIVDLGFFPPESKEYRRALKISAQLLKVLGTSYDIPTPATHKLHKPGDKVDWLSGNLITKNYHSLRGRFLAEVSEILIQKNIKFYTKVLIGVYEASFFLPDYNMFIFTVGPSGVSLEYDRLIPKYELRENCMRWKGFNSYTLVAQFDSNFMSPQVQLELALEHAKKKPLRGVPDSATKTRN